MKNAAVQPQLVQSSPSAPTRAGSVLLASVAVLVTLAVLPVILRGAPLADDYGSCTDVQAQGFTEVARIYLETVGIIRPARYLEIALIGGLCSRVHFGLIILVPFALTLAVALLLRQLLRDLDVPSPWPAVAAALWLLQPLGTEAALWPSALHVPLGLGFVLIALRLFYRGRYIPAALSGAAACLSIEQAIFALPVAAWLVATGKQRTRALVVGLGVSLAVLTAYRLWPGSIPRPPLTIGGMIQNVFSEPFFYVRFPATSLGLHSVPLAITWAFPFSIIVLFLGSLLLSRFGPVLLAHSREARGIRSDWRMITLLLLLALLINFPAMVVIPHPNAPRVFTPTWLMLAAVAAIVGSQIKWRRPRLVGGVAGFLMTALLLSIAFSASVRYRTGGFESAAAHWLAARVSPGDLVTICEVPRTAVPYAPTGDFHLHAFMWPWAAGPALLYYTGVDAEFRLAFAWDEGCTEAPTSALTLEFDELQAAVRTAGNRGRSGGSDE